MTKQIIEALVWGFASGLLGVVYRYILGKEEAFNWWWRFGAKYEGKTFFKPVWACSHCFAGQFALWTFFALRTLPGILKSKTWITEAFFIEWLGYAFHRVFTGLLLWTFCVAAAIFTAKVISFIFERRGI